MYWNYQGLHRPPKSHMRGAPRPQATSGPSSGVYRLACCSRRVVVAPHEQRRRLAESIATGPGPSVGVYNGSQQEHVAMSSGGSTLHSPKCWRDSHIAGRKTLRHHTRSPIFHADDQHSEHRQGCDLGTLQKHSEAHVAKVPRVELLRVGRTSPIARKTQERTQTLHQLLFTMEHAGPDEQCQRQTGKAKTEKGSKCIMEP